MVASICRWTGVPAQNHGCFDTGKGPGCATWGSGALHTVTLAEARDKALACRKQRLDGVDPIADIRTKSILPLPLRPRSMSLFSRAAVSGLAARGGAGSLDDPGGR